MSVYRDILKKIAPFMKSKGFLRSGYSGRFYYVANDIAYCILFEKPSIFIYVNAYIMPLYIPTEFVYLSYGARLNDLCRLEFPTISENNPDFIEEWCAMFCKTIEDKIIPIFKQISSPERLIRELEQESPSLIWFLSCPPFFIEKLKMYTYLYLQSPVEAESAIDRYRKELSQCSYFTEKSVQQFYDQSNVVEALIHEDRQKRESFIANTIECTKNAFYKKA